MSELSAALPANQEATPGNERRVVVRYPCYLGTSCHALPGDAATEWPARVRDISTSGIGLLVRRPFEPGTLLGVDLVSEDESLTYTLLTEVMHTRAQGGD